MTERDDAQTEALWRSIVENYGERVVLDPEADPAPGGTPDAPDAVARQRPAPDEADDRLDAYDDPEDHFVPPAPPPLGAPEPPRLLAWAGVLGVPVLTIALTALSVSVPSWASLLGLVWFVGGFGYLVATMRRDDEDDDWDDGAVL